MVGRDYFYSNFPLCSVSHQNQREIGRSLTWFQHHHPPPLAQNSKSLGVTGDSCSTPPEEPSCFLAPLFSHLNPFTVFLSVNPAARQCGKGPL